MASPKARILCTDDDADTRDLLAFILEDEGFEVVCTNDPVQALSLAHSRSIDLYLLDSWMPGLSGHQLTRKIREFDSETPILFYSGAGEASDRESAGNAGAQGYLVKPATHEALIAEVSRLLAESKIARPAKAKHAI